MADKVSKIYYTDNDKNINISFHKMTNWKKVTNIKTVDLFHNRSTVGTFIILKALFISDPSVKLICKAINFINFLSIMPSPASSGGYLVRRLLLLLALEYWKTLC